jgi:hypothetical protein
MKWVSELIDQGTRSWKEDVIREFFWPHDAQCILSIKLPSRAQVDFLAWNGESNGTFSVRSAYRIGMQPILEKLDHGQSSSAPSGERKVWDLVWKARVP